MSQNKYEFDFETPGVHKVISLFEKIHFKNPSMISTSSGVFSLNSSADPPSSSDGYSGNLPVLSL